MQSTLTDTIVVEYKRTIFAGNFVTGSPFCLEQFLHDGSIYRLRIGVEEQFRFKDDDLVFALL